jgi:hypothetical protein
VNLEDNIAIEIADHNQSCFPSLASLHYREAETAHPEMYILTS